MHIAIIHRRLVLRGGLETRLLNYTRELTRRGHRVTVVCYKRDRGVELPEGVEVVQLELGPVPNPFRKYRFAQVVRRHLRRSAYDYTLSLGRTGGQQAVLAPGNHLGYLAARGKRGRSVSDRLQVALDRMAYRESDVVFPCSAMMRDELHALYGVALDRMRILYPPLDTAAFSDSLQPQREPLRQALATEHDLPLDKVWLLFVSTGHERKGLPVLDRILPDLPDCHLLVAGYPDPRLRHTNYTYLGFVKQPATLYTAADLTVHPAVYEPFGQVVSESLACGTPVYVSEGVGAKEVLGSGGRILPTHDDAAWVAALRSYRRADYPIPTDWAEQHSLPLADHVDRLLAPAVPQQKLR